MTKPSTLARRLFALALALAAPAAMAAADTSGLDPAGTDIGNTASLQRGAALYVNYCAGCHSLEFQRFSRLADDLGLTEEQVQASLNFAGIQFGDVMRTGIDPGQGVAWFGQAPPDLSLVTRARGVDWVYTYLRSFYVDEERPLGWNNALFSGASMPNPLWELQGMQHAVLEQDEEGELQVAGMEITQPGRLTEPEFNQVVRDITAFLEYVGEPAALQRRALGVWVLLFLLVLTGLTWLLKREYWRDVH